MQQFSGKHGVLSKRVEIRTLASQKWRNMTNYDPFMTHPVGTHFEDFSGRELLSDDPLVHLCHGRVEKVPSFPKRVSVQSLMTVWHELLRSMTRCDENHCFSCFSWNIDISQKRPSYCGFSDTKTRIKHGFADKPGLGLKQGRFKHGIWLKNGILHTEFD